MTFRRILAPLLVLLALALFIQSVQAGETAKAFDYRSAVNKVVLRTEATTTTAPATDTWYWNFKTQATLVDFMCTQVTAGTSGTDVNFNILKAGTTMLTTLGQIPIGSGADVSIDAKKELTAVANTVRPVIKPLGSAIRVSKGDKITIVTTEDGSYSPHPTYKCSAIFLPDE